MKQVKLNENVSSKSHKHNCDTDTKIEVLSKNPSKLCKNLSAEFDKRLKKLSNKVNLYWLYVYNASINSYCFLQLGSRNDLFYSIIEQFNSSLCPVKVAFSRSFFSFKNSDFVYNTYKSDLSYLKAYISFIDNAIPVSLLFPVPDPSQKLIFFVVPYVESSL